MTNNENPDKFLDDLNVPTYDPNQEPSETASFKAQPAASSFPRPEGETSVFPTVGTDSGQGFSVGTPAAPTYAAPPSTIPAEPFLNEGPSEKEVEGRSEDPRRGTIDFGLLLARLALSVYLIIVSVSTFFKLGGSEGLTGLEADFAAYDFPHLLALVVPILQLIAGIFLLLGLVTPLFAMLALVVTGFTAIHEVATTQVGLNIFAWPEAVWLSVVLFILALALQFTGPGVISLDFSRSWARRPLATSWIFVILGIAALVAAWWFGAGVNPLS